MVGLHNTSYFTKKWYKIRALLNFNSPAFTKAGGEPTGWGFAKQLQGRIIPPLVTSNKWQLSHTSWVFSPWWGEMTRLDEVVRGDTAGAQTDKNHRWMDGQMKKFGFSFALTSFLDVCHRFGGLLRRFCQCISFSWFVYVPSLSCVYKSWPLGAGMHVKGDQLSLDCGTTLSNIKSIEVATVNDYRTDCRRRSDFAAPRLTEPPKTGWHVDLPCP